MGVFTTKLTRGARFSGRTAAIAVVAVVAGVALALTIHHFTAAGGQDRTAMAKDRLDSYWYDVEHGKWNQAYQMLTPGNRQQLGVTDFRQEFLSELEATSGFTEHTGRIDINGDFAVARVSLEAAKAPGVPFTRYQHLYWDGSNWYVSDQFGGLSTRP